MSEHAESGHLTQVMDDTLSLVLFYSVGITIAYFLFRRIVLEAKYIQYKGRYVFVTGCDSGFGHLLALQLVSMGVNVFAGCYTEQGETELKKKVSTKSQASLWTINLDVTKDSSVANARKTVEALLSERGAQLHSIVNNAGVFTIFGPDDWCSTDEYANSLNVNTLGAVRVCHEFMPLLKKSKGRIVTMGSTAGRLHGLFVGPYVVAKFAVEAYMDCLRLEAKQFGVSVHLLEPGCFKTDLLNEDAQIRRVNTIWNRQSEDIKNEYGEEYVRNFKIAWQQGVNIVANKNLNWVVSCYIHAMFAAWPRLRYAPGWDAIFCFIPLSILPTFIQDTILSFMYSLQRGPPLVPACLKNKSVPSFRFARLKWFISSVCQASLLSLTVFMLWLRSSYHFVTAKSVEAGQTIVVNQSHVDRH